MARPSSLNWHAANQFIASLQHDGNLENAYRASGVSDSTYRSWRALARNPDNVVHVDFCRRVDKAMKDGKDAKDQRMLDGLERLAAHSDSETNSGMDLCAQAS